MKPKRIKSDKIAMHVRLSKKDFVALNKLRIEKQMTWEQFVMQLIVTQSEDV